MKQFKFTINDNEYQVTVNKVKNDIAHVAVNGIPYKVIMDKSPKQQRATVKRPAQVLTTETNHAPIAHTAVISPVYSVKAPLPGVIISIDCKVGDVVKKGQTLLVLEAMKMENSIPADHDGEITEIKVKTGDSVMENADLVLIR